MLPTPRIIAIDDDEKHLDGITKGLNQYGAACLPIHFTGDTDDIKSYPHPHVRVIFADLHLTVGSVGNDHAQHFSLIVSLIEGTIQPSGPYILILWTRYAEEAARLQQFLEERLQDIPKPLSVTAIDKTPYLNNGDLKNPDKLVEEIEKSFQHQPQISAILNWEKQVSDAAADTVSSIFSLATTSSEAQERGKDVGRLLARLAVEAVGNDHVEQDRFRAVNEALLPILADHIAAMRSPDSDNEIWMGAFDSSDAESALSLEEAARLNSQVHIASVEGNQGAERGAVIDLPDELSSKFEQTFDLTQEVAAEKQFRCKDFAPDKDEFRWVLVQCQAVCDYAQTQPGPLPYYLGLELPETFISKSGKPPTALWTSPPFNLNNVVRHLHVNARLQISLPNSKVKEARPRYRLREQLISDLIFHIHSYGARPGMLSFRGSKAKQQSSQKKGK